MKPEKWKIDYSAEGWTVIRNQENYLIAETRSHYANIIAAVPELYEALELLYNETKEYIEINHLGDPHHNQGMKLAFRSLAKAKGEVL